MKKLALVGVLVAGLVAAGCGGGSDNDALIKNSDAASKGAVTKGQSNTSVTKPKNNSSSSSSGNSAAPVGDGSPSQADIAAGTSGLGVGDALGAANIPSDELLIEETG